MDGPDSCTSKFSTIVLDLSAQFCLNAALIQDNLHGENFIIKSRMNNLLPILVKIDLIEG